MYFEIKEGDSLQHAKNELNLLDEDSDIKFCLLRLLEKLHSQGHSGMSAAIVTNTFVNLVKDGSPIPGYLFTEEEDFYGGMTGTALEELMEVYDNNCQHCDKSKVLGYFHKLAFFKPITPLTFSEDEWHLVDNGDNMEIYQNRRDYSVFKDGKDSRPHTINAYYMRNQEGDTFIGSLETPKGTMRNCYGYSKRYCN